MLEPQSGRPRPPGPLARIIALIAPASSCPPGHMLMMMLTMAMIVATANYGVLRPINDWLTMGHFIFPFAFLFTDLMNRLMGSAAARRVVLGGFLVAVAVSWAVASPRVAVASGTAFLVGQWVDIWIFDRLRHERWWRAPAISSAVASVVDTALFYSLAFAGTGGTWIQWGLADLGVKLLMIPPLLGMFWFHAVFMWRWLFRRD